MMVFFILFPNQQLLEANQELQERPIVRDVSSGLNIDTNIRMLARLNIWWHVMNNVKDCIIRTLLPILYEIKNKNEIIKSTPVLLFVSKFIAIAIKHSRSQAQKIVESNIVNAA